MPTVPRYNEPTVRETARPYVPQGSNLPLDAFGGGQSQQGVVNAVQGIADVGMKIAQEEKLKADQLSVLDAERKKSALETELQYNPQSGALNKKGRDAFALPDQIKSAWDKGIEEIEKDLHNETQRMAFKKSEQTSWNSLNNNIQRHVAGEISKYDNDVTESSLANERDAASVNYMDPNRIGLSIENQKKWITDHANRNGLPAQWIEQKTNESISKTQVSVINRMLANGQDQLATAYFEKYKPTITDGDSLNSVEKAIKEGTLRGQSQRTTDQIQSSYGTWSERMDAASKIQDPNVRDEVDRRLKTNMATEKTLQQQLEERVTLDATNIIEKFKDFDQVPPAMVQNMTPSTRKALRGYADDLREGKRPVTDWDQYYNLKTMAATPDLREKFMRENLLSYRPQMADAEFKELVNLQTTLRNGKEDPELDGYRTNVMIVNGTLNDVGIDPTPKPGSDAARKVNGFQKVVDDQIRVFQQQTGKKATNKDVQTIVDNLIIEGSVPGTGFLGLFKTKKRAFELEPGETLVASDTDKAIGYGGIPAGERAKIIDALKRNGIQPTDEKIMSLYLKKARNAP